MEIPELLKDKQAIIFELDNVLFPEKDYLLQVYYLFAQFIEYAEQKEAQPILAFLQLEFEQTGSDWLFEKTAAKFKIDQKYQYNFDLLHQNARLPLKLLLFQKMLIFLQELVVNRIKIFIVTSGDPLQQLNKIKQIEWNGLEQYLTVYFVDELKQTKAEIFQNMLVSSNLSTEQMLVVGANNFDAEQSKVSNLPYIESVKIYE